MTTHTITLTGASMRQAFNGCDPDFIRTVCHARCCDAPTRPTGTMITILPADEAAIVRRGGVIIDGLLQPRPGERVCPFKDPDSFLCTLHATPDKPFGCIASPFTLSKHDRLIVRNRYRLLPCYRAGNLFPAYRAFRASLVLLFGEEKTARITEMLDDGADVLTVEMSDDVYRSIRSADAIKRIA